MRSRPAHISRDTGVDTAAALPPPKTKARKQRAFRPCRVDKAHSMSAREQLDPETSQALAEETGEPTLEAALAELERNS